jgi:hypothetical protein
MALSVRVEYADQRKLRTRNTAGYRAAHWPIWIWVFFLAPGPLTFDLFERGGSARNLAWLSLVLVGTGTAALFGKLPGAEPAPYILRFTEDRPNPRYRRICYTFAWNALLNFAALNLAGLAWAAATGQWRMKQIYAHGYTPVLIVILLPSESCRAFAAPRREKARSAATSMERFGRSLPRRPSCSFCGRRCPKITPRTS